MPRKVLASLLHEIQRDITARFAPGDRYRSVRDIARHFKVSLQTAHRGVTRMVEAGMLEAKAKSGLHVRNTRPDWSKIPGRIVFLSNHPDPRFNQAVLSGLRDVFSSESFELRLVLNTHPDTNSLSFGEWITGLGADGIVAMGFRDAGLPFYHAQIHGVNIVSGIILDELPTLPAVQHNNTLHAEEAARALHQLGKKRVLCAGYWDPAENKRFEAFRSTFRSLSPKVEISYAWLARAESVARLHLFFMHFRPETDAVFSLEYSANYAVAPYFVSHGIPPTDNFIVFNSEECGFHLPGQPPVRAVAPSLRETGRCLAGKLLGRLRTGEWPGPLCETI